MSTPASPHHRLAVLLVATLALAAGCQFGPGGSGATPTATATASPSPTATPTPTPRPTADFAFTHGPAADAPPDGLGAAVRPAELAELPPLYRQHYRAVRNGSYRFRARLVADPTDDRTAHLTVTSVRGSAATLDRTVLVANTTVGDGGLRRRTLAAYRAGGPTLFYRSSAIDGDPLDRVSGTLQGVAYGDAVGVLGGSTPPWRVRDLVVRLAAAGAFGEGEQVVVDGTTMTRYRATELDRRAYDSLGLPDRSGPWSVLPDWELYYEDPYPAYEGSIVVDGAGRIRRVNITLAQPPIDEEIPTTVHVTARLEPRRVSLTAPRWVERTPRVQIRAVPADGTVVAVEHRGGPAVALSGTLETRTESSVTLFPFFTLEPVDPGETLHVAVVADDDGNEMEVATTIGSRPVGPFVDVAVRTFDLSGEPDGPREDPPLTHEFHVGLNASATAA